jgi:hypothetical protein
MLRILERQLPKALRHPIALSDPAMILFHNPMHIKKATALRLISFVCVFFGLIEHFGVCVQFFLN